MRARVVAPAASPAVQEVENTLESLQNMVGGYLECVYPFGDPVALLCNEEGKLSGLPYNRALRTEEGKIYDIVAGTFLIVGLGEGDFADLSEELAAKYTELYRWPEIFLTVDGKIHCVKVQNAAE